MTLSKKTALVLTSASILALVTATAASAAADPAKGSVDELVVTAQKRAERVENVPLSINVINDAQIERQQVYNVFDLSRVAPSLEVTNASGQAPGGGGQVRGIGTQSFGTGAVGSVGLVVDGVSQGNVNILDLFDIARIEVLKGPQGTLFGLTTSAGVINITTRAPSFTEFTGQARTELSAAGKLGSTGYGQQVVQGAVNIPISGIAGLRLSGSVNRREGPNRNALDGTLDGHDSDALRGRLLLKPTQALTVNVIGDYARAKGDGPDFFTVYKADPAFTTQLANCRLAPTAQITPVIVGEGNRDYCTTNSASDGNKVYGGSVTFDYTLKPFTLTAISAAHRSRSLASGVGDIFRLANAFYAPPPAVMPTEIKTIGQPNPGPTDLITQEFRIASPTGSKLEYTLGVFYSNQTSRNNGGSITQVSDTFFPGTTPTVLTRTVGNPSSSQGFSKAAFGQATYHLTDALGLIAGVRFTDEVLKQRNIQGGAPARTRTAINNTSWRLGLQYKPDETLMTYATIARGYKGPQLAAPPTGSAPGTPSRVVNPEIPTNYEVGAKKVMFGGRAIADLSAFYTEVDGFQGQVCITDPVTQLLGCSITNFEGVISKGIEANLFGRISDDFTINTGLIWNRATYPKTSRSATGVVGPYLAPDGTNLSGAQLVNAPEWKFTFSGEYSHPISTGLQGFVSADAVYKSKIRYAPSTNPLLSYHGNVVLGGRVGVRAADGAWTAAVYVRNLTNEHVPVLRQAGFPYGQNYGQFLSTGAFRVVGVTLEGRF